MLHENDVVRLKHNIPANSPTEWPGIPSTALDAGTIGSVVMVYTTDSVNYEYEVEFVDGDGHTLALLTLKEMDIEPVDSSFRCLFFSLADLRMVVHKMYLEKIQQKQEVLRQAGFEEFVPCTEEEIAKLEDWLGHRLPLAYREFLLWMGHWGGGLFRGSDCFYENLRDLQEWTRTLLEEDKNPIQLPEDAFTFFMHQGYQFFFFRLSEGEDPPIYCYLEDDNNPAESNFARQTDHFSDWLDSCVDKGVEAATTLAARIQKRKGSAPGTGQGQALSAPTDSERAFAENRRQHNKYDPAFQYDHHH